MPHHDLRRRDDLARFGGNCSDDAILRRDERRVRGLIARDAQVRLRLLELRAVGVHRVALRVERGGADELLLEEMQVALVLGLREVVLVLRGGDLLLRRLRLQADVRRVEPRQHLALAHVRAGIDRALDDLAADPEREIGFVARLHFAREHRGVAAAARDDLREHDGARGIGDGFLLRATGGEQDRGSRDEGSVRSGSSSDLRRRADHSLPQRAQRNIEFGRITPGENRRRPLPGPRARRAAPSADGDICQRPRISA